MHLKVAPRLHRGRALPLDEARPLQRRLGHPRVDVRVVSRWRVHNVSVGWGLHGLLGVRLSSHHAHLHRVLGRLVHVSVVTVVATVHGGVAHAVAIERGHVHGVVGGRGGH